MPAHIRFSVISSALSAFCFFTQAATGAAAGNPIEHLSEQLESLQQQVDQLTASSLPVEVSVDCAAGESIAPVLEQHQYTTAPLTINITGVCNEQVFIFGDRVTLRGVDSTATIASNAPMYGTVTVSHGARDASVENLKLVGGKYGILVARNSHAIFRQLDITGASGTGLIAIDNSYAAITDSTIHQVGTSAVYAGSNSSVRVSASNLEFNGGPGAVADTLGTIALENVDPLGFSTSGPVVRNNSYGVVVQNGGHAILRGAEIKFASIGVVVRTQGSASLTESNVISSNYIAGIYAQTNTSLTFDSSNSITGNYGWGINCLTDTAYLILPPGATPGDVSGNPWGNILGCSGP